MRVLPEENTKWDFILRASIFLFWTMLILFAISEHTPWRDEYQSWLVSTRTKTWGEFLEAIRYERHPPLHYILQRLLDITKLATNLIPQVQIQFVTFPFVMGSAVLILFGLDLSLGVAVLLLFNSYLFREYGVISRAYSIGTFFILLSAYAGKRKKIGLESASLCFAASCHLLYTLGASAIFFYKIIGRELKINDLKRWIWIPMWILILFLVQIPPADTLFQTQLNLGLKSLANVPYFFVQALTGLEPLFQKYQWNLFVYSQDSVYILAPLLVYFLSKVMPWRYFFFVVFPIIVFLACIDATYYRYLGILYVFVLGFLAVHNQLTIKKLFPFVFLVIPFLSWCSWWWQWSPWQESGPSFAFSDARNLVTELQKKGFQLGDPEVTLSVTDEARYITVMAESLSSNFVIERNSKVSYPKFIKIHNRLGLEDYCKDLAQNQRLKPGSKDKILLGLRLGQTLPSECSSAQLIYRTEKQILTDESYEVYSWN